MNLNGTLTCPVCLSPRLSHKPFGYSFHGRWLGAVGCRQCGVIFLHPQPSGEEIASMYSKEYFEGDFRCGHAGSAFDASTFDRLVDRTLLDRIRMHKAGGAFLEIGCAGGAFLDAARSAGFSARGVEFSADAAEFARATFGLEVSTGDVFSAALPAGAFDVVMMADVLEHLPSPVATLKEIHRIMKPGGLLVIICPTQTNTIFSRLGMRVYAAAGKRAVVNLPPYHLFEYRPTSMQRLAGVSGFEVVRSVSHMIPPGEIALRGGLLQNLGKKLFHYPNYALTRLFGVLGDRIELFALKRGETGS